MMRSRHNPDSFDEPLDPAIQAELDQLDAALRGEPIDDDALAALVRDVQATAPEMPADLRKQLRHDVADGFGRGGFRGALKLRDGRRTPGAKRSGSLVFGGGLAATLLVLVGVGVAVTATSTFTSTQGGGLMDASSESAAPAGDDSVTAASGGASSGPTADSLEPFANQAAPSDLDARERSSGAPNRLRSAGGDQASKGGLSTEQQALVDRTLQAQPNAGTASKTPATGRRRVEQTVDMTVRVKNGQLDESTGKVEDIVRLGGGYVADSRVSLRSRGAGTATYTLKVASSKLDQTIKRLAELGTVTSQEQASRDITSSFDSVQQRLDDNKRVRAALLRSLAKAETDGQIASLNRRLADNRRSRESLEGQLARLRTRTDLTTVQLALRAPSSSAADVDDDGNWSLGDAASDAVSALGAITGALLVGAAVLLPFAILAAIAWALYRVRRKRARESTLDS